MCLISTDKESTDKTAFPSKGALCAAFKKSEVKPMYRFNTVRCVFTDDGEWMSAEFLLFCFLLHVCVCHSVRSFWNAADVFPVNLIPRSDAPLVCVPWSCGGLIWCFCFPGSHWREHASSSPSRGGRSRPSVCRRGSRCGLWTLKGLYWACSRRPPWLPNWH